MTYFKSNIYTLAKIHGALKFIFGSRKVIPLNGKFEENGKLYKVFSFSISLTLNILYFLGTIHYIIKLKGFGVMSIYVFVIFLSYFSTNCAYFLLMIFYITNGSAKTKKIYDSLVEIDVIFKKLNESENYQFFKNVVFFYGIFISVDIYIFIIELDTWDMDEKFICSISCLFLFFVELELINFYIEINEIARRLEIINAHLINISIKKKNDKIDFFDLDHSFLTMIWGKKHKALIFNQSYEIDQLSKIFLELSLIIKEYNSIYGIIVSFENSVYFYLHMNIICYI